MKAIRIHSNGGPEVLKYEDCPIPELKPGLIRIKNVACGANFIDIYHRTGLYPVKLPYIIGGDGAGIIDAVGEGETQLKVGDRVAYLCGSNGSGSYAEYSTAPAINVTQLPESMSFEEGTAAMIQGLTAHYLVKGSYYVKPGDTVFVHAVAGGLGGLICQMAKHLGARVIGTTSTEEKAKYAIEECGCDEVILYTQKDFEEEAKRLTNGKGVNVVYDSIGKDTFEKSINILAPRGFIVAMGNASGKPPLLDPLTLSAKGSLTLNRPKLFDYVRTREEFLERAEEVFKWAQEGHIKLRIAVKFPLNQAAEAHKFLEARKTTGKVILTP